MKTIQNRFWIGLIELEGETIRVVHDMEPQVYQNLIENYIKLANTYEVVYSRYT